LEATLEDGYAFETLKKMAKMESFELDLRQLKSSIFNRGGKLVVNIVLIFSLVIGIFVIVILVRYLYSKRKFPFHKLNL